MPIKSQTLFFIFGLSLAFFALPSCNSMSGSYVEKKSVNASLPGLIKAFDRASNGLRGKSVNGREIVSRYQKPGTDSYDNAGMDKERAYSRLLILNDRRPYTIQLQYVIEERISGGGYSIKGYDDAMANKVMRKMMEFLVNRPDREDFIDEFKAF